MVATHTKLPNRAMMHRQSRTNLALCCDVPPEMVAQIGTQSQYCEFHQNLIAEQLLLTQFYL